MEKTFGKSTEGPISREISKHASATCERLDLRVFDGRRVSVRPWKDKILSPRELYKTVVPWARGARGRGLRVRNCRWDQSRCLTSW